MTFEEGFKEHDELFRSELRETDEAHDQRSKHALDGVFGKGEDGEGKTWVSLSSHSGAIASLLRGKFYPFPFTTSRFVHAAQTLAHIESC